jgi:hypothetical protein
LLRFEEILTLVIKREKPIFKTYEYGTLESDLTVTGTPLLRRNPFPSDTDALLGRKRRRKLDQGPAAAVTLTSGSS